MKNNLFIMLILRLIIKMLSEVLEKEQDEIGECNPQITYFKRLRRTFVHYRKIKIELVDTPDGMILESNETTNCLRHIIITTPSERTRTYDEALEQINKLEWYFDGELILNISGKYLVQIMKLNAPLYKSMIEIFLKGSVVIPIQQLIFDDQSLCFPPKTKINIRCEPKDNYKCFCEGYILPSEYFQVTFKHKYSILQNVYDIFETIQDINLSNMKINDIVVLPMHEMQKYEIKLDNVKLIRGDNPMLLLDQTVIHNKDNYYYHAIGANYEHNNAFTGLFFTKENTKITITPSRANISVIIKHKKLLRNYDDILRIIERKRH